jgi:hypothetical protein
MTARTRWQGQETGDKSAQEVSWDRTIGNRIGWTGQLGETGGEDSRDRITRTAKREQEGQNITVRTGQLGQDN